MRRFFAKNLLFILALNALVKPVWIFAIDRTVQNRVGHAAYGTFSALLNMSVILQVVLDFGLNSYNTRAVSRDPHTFPERFPPLLGLRIILVGIYAIAVLITGHVAGYKGTEMQLLCGTLLIQTLTILLLFIRSNVAAFQRFRLDGLLSVADRLLMILLCGTLLLLPSLRGRFRIEWFVWAQVGCYAAAVVLGFAILRRITGQPIRISFHFARLGSLMREAAPYALLIFLMSIYMRIDTTLVERLANKDEAGRYAAAGRQLDVCNQFALLFAGILLPLFGRMLSKKEDVAPVVRLSANLLLPFSILGAVAAWTCGTGIMHLLYPASDAYDGRLLAWMMSCLPAYSLVYIYSTLLTAGGALRLLNRFAAGAVVLNVGLNMLLIPRLGAEGAAMVACLTQWAIAATSVLAATRRLSLPVHPRWLASLLAFAALLAATGAAAHQAWEGDWVRILAIEAVAAAVLIPLFRFIHPAQLRALLSRR